ILDTSGFKLHMTTQLRKYDIGITWTGIAVGNVFIIPPTASSYRAYGYCDTSPPNKDMSKAYPDMKILGSILHTHLTGSGVRVLQFRDGKQIGVITQDKNYDFNLQEARLLREPIPVQRGDVLITECTFNTEKRTQLTFGGLATDNEMCLVFMHYYPRNDLLACLSFQNWEIVSDALNISVSSEAELYQTLGQWNWTQNAIREMEEKLRDAVQILTVSTRTVSRSSVSHRTLDPFQSSAEVG
ncbi:DBH-like monooxygenase protein 2, partial [Heterodontus francisci]|uniref:DBH-like monooxygenase protein 2 n=1 Tax=Heterodontus francisci TaxID=7792 RepID=UPI00355BF1FB